jgi:hypothetical protein
MVFHQVVFHAAIQVVFCTHPALGIVGLVSFHAYQVFQHLLFAVAIVIQWKAALNGWLGREYFLAKRL